MSAFFKVRWAGWLRRFVPDKKTDELRSKLTIHPVLGTRLRAYPSQALDFHDHFGVAMSMALCQIGYKYRLQHATVRAKDPGKAWPDVVNLVKFSP